MIIAIWVLRDIENLKNDCKGGVWGGGGGLYVGSCRGGAGVCVWAWVFERKQEYLNILYSGLKLTNKNKKGTHFSLCESWIFTSVHIWAHSALESQLCSPWVSHMLLWVMWEWHLQRVPVDSGIPTEKSSILTQVLPEGIPHKVLPSSGNFWRK